MKKAIFSIFILIVISSPNLFAFAQNLPESPPRADYNIDCTFNFDSTKTVVTGEAIISFENISTRPLEQLIINWTTDSTQKLMLEQNGKTLDLLTSNPDDWLYFYKLPQKLMPGEKLEINVRFERTYFIEKEDNKHLWTDWFPRLEWGKNSQDNFNVKINNRSDFTLGTSGAYDPATLSYRADNVRRFGVYFLKNGQRLKDSSAGTTIEIIHTPEATTCAEFIMATAVDAIAFYKKRFGFFPTSHMTIAQGVDAPNGGYPPATNLVVIHGLERMAERDSLHWQWITAHELGHQYWFEHVLSASRRQIGWLMIGLGIYVDREYIRVRGLPNDQHLGLMERYTNGVREGIDTRADLHDDYLREVEFDFNNVVTHGKGYSIISALNRLIGDEQFDKIHARCLEKFGGRTMNYHQFQQVCEDITGEDYDWFFDQAVRTKRFIAYTIQSQECTPADDKYFTEVAIQKEGTFYLPVPVTAFFADKTTQTKFTERLFAHNNLSFISDAPLDSVVIDQDHEIAMVLPAPTAEELSLRQQLSNLPSKTVIDSLEHMVNNALVLNIDNTYFWGVLGRKLFGWEKYDLALIVFQKRLELLQEIESNWVASAYGWQGLLYDLLGQRELAIEAYQKALAIEFDREFSYSGDPVIINRAWLEERLEKPFTKN